MQLVVVSIIIALLPVHASPMGPKMARADPSASIPQVRRQAEVTRDSCVDDSNWVDQDGDGCAVYAKHIQNNEISQTEACDYSGGAAKVYCQATCGLCQEQSRSMSFGATIDHQIERFWDGINQAKDALKEVEKLPLINNVLTAITSSGSTGGDSHPTVRLEHAKQSGAETVFKSLNANRPCVDDPDWVDADGDGCAVYADHIAAESFTREEACMYGNGNARDHCRATCGTCIYDEPQAALARDNSILEQGSSTAETAPAPIPRPHRAPVSPKMVPAGPVSSPGPAPRPDPEACMDEPKWTDPDGDSCAEYADKIQAGEFLLEEACNYADEAAKKHCPKTCKTCPAKAETSNASSSIAKKDACIDDPDWVDQDGDSCVAYATAIKEGSITKEEACNYSDGKAKKHCSLTCDMCTSTEHILVHHNILAHKQAKPVGPKMTPQDPDASVAKKGACIDDPDWADQDGDDCAAYAKAIKDGQISQTEACAFSGGKAKEHCLVTCNACPRVHSSAQNLLHNSPSTSEAVQLV